MVTESNFQPKCWMLNGRVTVVPIQGIFIPRICGLPLDWSLTYLHQSVHCECVQYKSQGREIESQKTENTNLIRAGMESDMIRVLSYEDLHLYTDGFSEENFIGIFQFGKVYRGKIESQRVTVKIWEDPLIYRVNYGDNERRLRDEIILLQHPNLFTHPNLVKLMGYCYEGEKLGIVYDLDALDTVHNLILKDSLTWLQRVNVALGFARLLKFLHTQNPRHLPCLVRNISAAHIMLDQDYNPKLYDFGMISGGIFPDRRYNRIEPVNGCYGYVDHGCLCVGPWSEDCDVFGFGVVLLGLITKRLYTEEVRMSHGPTVFEWAQEEYEQSKLALGFDESKFSLVHKSLESEPGFHSSDGPKLTMLAVQCTQFCPFGRPTMKQIVKYLLKLHVIQRHADTGHNINSQDSRFFS